MFQLVPSIESRKFSRVTSLKFAIVATHENDSSTKENY